MAQVTLTANRGPDGHWHARLSGSHGAIFGEWHVPDDVLLALFGAAALPFLEDDPDRDPEYEPYDPSDWAWRE